MIISSAVPHRLSSSSSNNISNTGKSNNLNLSAIFRKNTAYGCSSVAKQDLPDFLFLLLFLPKNRKYLSIFVEDPKLSKSGFVSDFFFFFCYHVLVISWTNSRGSKRIHPWRSGYSQVGTLTLHYKLD